MWKILCCVSMGVPMPSTAVKNVLKEQQAWIRTRQKKAEKDYLHKRYNIEHCKNVKYKFKFSHYDYSETSGRKTERTSTSLKRPTWKT